MGIFGFVDEIMGVDKALKELKHAERDENGFVLRGRQRIQRQKQREAEAKQEEEEYEEEMRKREVEALRRQKELREEARARRKEKMKRRERDFERAMELKRLKHQERIEEIRAQSRSSQSPTQSRSHHSDDRNRFDGLGSQPSGYGNWPGSSAPMPAGYTGPIIYNVNGGPGVPAPQMPGVPSQTIPPTMPHQGHPPQPPNQPLRPDSSNVDDIMAERRRSSSRERDMRTPRSRSRESAVRLQDDPTDWVSSLVGALMHALKREAGVDMRDINPRNATIEPYYASDSTTTRGRPSRRSSQERRKMSGTTTQQGKVDKRGSGKFNGPTPRGSGYPPAAYGKKGGRRLSPVKEEPTRSSSSARPFAPWSEDSTYDGGRIRGSSTPLNFYIPQNASQHMYVFQTNMNPLPWTHLRRASQRGRVVEDLGDATDTSGSVTPRLVMAATRKRPTAPQRKPLGNTQGNARVETRRESTRSHGVENISGSLSTEESEGSLIGAPVTYTAKKFHLGSGTRSPSQSARV